MVISLHQGLRVEQACLPVIIAHDKNILELTIRQCSYVPNQTCFKHGIQAQYEK